MNHTLVQPVVDKKKKRLGRGHGSGRVKTSGRGTKGQNARDSARLGFEGGQLPLSRKLPFLRGKEKNISYKERAIVLPVQALAVFSKNTAITIAALREKGLLHTSDKSVKILGGGTLDVPLQVKVPVSKSAKASIEAAGGTVTLEN